MSRKRLNGSANESICPWSLTTDQVVKTLGTDVNKGLSPAQVQALHEQYGFNELVKQPGKPLWKLVLEQFDDMLVKVRTPPQCLPSITVSAAQILLLAAVISFVLAYFEEAEGNTDVGLRAYIEPLVILLILVLNAIVGVWQESNAEAALEALKELQTETANVVRNGRVVRHRMNVRCTSQACKLSSSRSHHQVSDLPARELVPGDVVQLHMGDKVPADLRLLLLKTAIIRVEQASLTGEAVPVAKQPNVTVTKDIELQVCVEGILHT